MAKINNQAVLQKLMDELKLYPAKDAVPTELAEKILPVFQINSEEVTVSTEKSNIVRGIQSTGGTGGNDETIYTTPATGKFYLTNVSLSVGVYDAAAPRGGLNWVSVVIDGATQIILGNRTSIPSGGLQMATQSLNLQNPVLLDSSSIIIVHATNTGHEAYGTIVGYTVD